uniref:Zgc:56585 n=1 Tax=Sinocyclocheilus grahami TaxID=75366 RepID=A0A672R175_SINGR
STLDQEYGRDRTEFYLADVTSEEDFKVLEEIVKTFGRIDILCNNAGIINEKHWEKTIAINLGGVVRGTYLALEHMKKENGGNGGVIINVSSMAVLQFFSAALCEFSQFTCNTFLQIKVLYKYNVFLEHCCSRCWSQLFLCLVIAVHESLVCPEQLNCLLFFRKTPSSHKFCGFPAFLCI